LNNFKNAPPHGANYSDIYGNWGKGIYAVPLEWRTIAKAFSGDYDVNSEFYIASAFSLDTNSDFVKVIGQIHKDLSYIIKLNMIDGHGNIEEEYDTNRNYVRGGYSLGSEIVKLNHRL
jgi:hypothetical protein